MISPDHVFNQKFLIAILNCWGQRGDFESLLFDKVKHESFKHFRFLKLSLSFGWAVKAAEPFFTFVFHFPSLPLCQLLSNLFAIMRRQRQTMEKLPSESTKDLNTKDGADLKKKHNCNQCNYSTDANIPAQKLET